MSIRTILIEKESWHSMRPMGAVGPLYLFTLDIFITTSTYHNYILRSYF